MSPVPSLIAGQLPSSPADSDPVQVGGSTGTAAIALATAFPHLTFIVQDLPANAALGRKAAQDSLPPDILSRLAFQGHDFTCPQPVRGAAVYLLRMILHDWPDDVAARILRHVVAAMDAESRLLVMDTVLPRPGAGLVSEERIVRARDLTMMQAFNSGERELEGWVELLGRVDGRLEVVGVREPVGSAMAVLEVRVRTGELGEGTVGE